MKRPYFHVVIIPLSFILYLFGQNINGVEFRDILLCLAIVLALTILLFLLFHKISRSWGKSALLSSIFFILFFDLDSISKMVSFILIGAGQDPNLNNAAEVSKFCAIDLAILYCCFLLVILHSKKEFRILNRAANLFAIGLIGIILGSILSPTLQQITHFGLASEISFDEEWQNNLKSEPDLLPVGAELPDIYYIVLDAYGRADMLEQFYGLDTQPFIDALVQKGFFVADESLANYKQTSLSISSALNMDYVNWLADDFGDEYNYYPLFNMIEHNRTFEQLRRLGYRIDSFATGYVATEIETADQKYHPAFYPNEFEMLVINTTPIGYLWANQLHDIHRERVRFTLKNLAKAGSQPGPDFVFAHIVSPHPPFVFGPNGEKIEPHRPYTIVDASDFMVLGTPDEYKTGYTNQVSYMNKEILSTIQEILQNSSTPPIIILQGDHGPGAEFDHEFLEKSNLLERYPILNAYYLPCESDESIPADITPVNSFRYVFNACFKAKLPYLENHQYFSPSSTPFIMTDVTDYFTTRVFTRNIWP